MYEISCFLEKWQTLIGAFLGGVFALAVALLVAYKVRRHDETGAAFMLITDLRNFIIAVETLDENIKKRNISKNGEPTAKAAVFALSPPTLSPLFEESVLRVSPIDIYLAAHLALFKIIFSNIEIALKRHSKYIEMHEATEEQTVPSRQAFIDIKTINYSLPLAVEHAKCCENLLDKLIIRRTAIFHRLIRTIREPKSESDCIRLLNEGQIKQSSQDTVEQR